MERKLCLSSLHHSCVTFVNNNDRFNRLNKEPKLLVKVVAHALNYVHVQFYYRYSIIDNKY